MEEAPLVSQRRALVTALLTLVLSGVFAIGSNRLHARPMEWFSPLPVLEAGDIDLLGARQLLGTKGAVFLDARPGRLYEGTHIRGAMSLPYRSFQKTYPKLESQLKDKILITYCSSPSCPKADALRAYLEDKGHQDVRVMRPGLSAWVKERLPTENGP